MRFPIGLKIFGIAVGLLILMAAAALLSMLMTRTVDGQLRIIDQNYFPAYVALAQANIRSVEESALGRRLLLAIERGDDAAKRGELHQQVASAGKTSDERIADARQYINRQIADPLDFDDNITLARLDDKIEALQEERQRYESILGKLLTAAAAGDKPLTTELLGDLDDWRENFDHKMDAARSEMRRLASAAIVGTRAYQQRVVAIGIALLAIAAALGITLAAAVTLSLVRPVRRLLLGTSAVERGALDTIVPITSRDEIGLLTRSLQ
jgi:HAMP domain-containing protein